MGSIGIFDSSSKSKTTNDSSGQAGFSDINDNATVANFSKVGTGKNSSTNISILDGGAIAKSFDFAKSMGKESFELAESSSAHAYDFSRDVAKNATASVSEAVKAVSESARTETENIFINLQKYALYAGLIWGAVQIFKGLK